MSKGNHTWEMHLRYHRCPDCGAILESRQPYQYRMGVYLKELECERCGARFTEKKQRRLVAGPLLGEGETPEVDWSSHGV